MPVFSFNGNIFEHDDGLFFVVACSTVVRTILLVINDWILETSQLRRVLERKK